MPLEIVALYVSITEIIGELKMKDMFRMAVNGVRGVYQILGS